MKGLLFSFKFLVSYLFLNGLLLSFSTNSFSQSYNRSSAQKQEDRVSDQKNLIGIKNQILEFKNFYWGNELKDNNGNLIFADENLYDLLTNEFIGNTSKGINYYYIPQEGGSPKYAENVDIKWINKKSNIFLSYKFKTKQNAQAWAKGARYKEPEELKIKESKTMSFINSFKKEKTKNNSDEESEYLAGLEKQLEDWNKTKNRKKYSGAVGEQQKRDDISWENELKTQIDKERRVIVNSTPQFSMNKIYGKYLPDFSGLIKYYKENKKYIYNTLYPIYPLSINYKGYAPDNAWFSIQNLMGQYIYELENSETENEKDIIFRKIYNYIYNGISPSSDWNDAINKNIPRKGVPSDGIANSYNTYVYLKEIGLFVTMSEINGGTIEVFDPINGPLYFTRNSTGFKFFDNQKESLSLNFNNSSRIMRYTPQTSNPLNLSEYYIENGVGVYDKIGLQFRPNDYGNTEYIWQGDQIPSFSYNKLDRINLNSQDYYIATNFFYEKFDDYFKYYPSQQSKILMAEAGTITVQQAADPNFFYMATKGAYRISDKKKVAILNSTGYAITPFFDEITQINKQFFKITKNGMYGLIFISPETIKQNNFLLIKPIYKELNATFFGNYLSVTLKSYNTNPNQVLNYDTDGNLISSN
jgi:hypothetical protein